MIGLVIEPLASHDVAACAEMMSQTDPWLRLGRGYDACREAILAPGRTVFIARAGDELAGLVVLNLTGAFVGYIQAVCVHPSQRGKGIGSQLLRFAEEYIFQRFPNVFLCVSSFNTNAQRLYSRLGYKTVGELENYVIPGASELLLRKTLGSLSEWKPRDEQ